ncbi:hypothetical protein RBU49_02400 [Clostridium sp. MB40-C1]|uniref:hypothetical protein n=1 Tax=Clostridium sp. MB40-C1 TaxID=3070996 RepID=UPI0027DFA00F|nr:hypothetical protein [Clostridium sp. MB40-C1]WMJ81121.1 hypothetical protein RBU49_02400 [Clostridium sp. MB40-C1]
MLSNKRTYLIKTSENELSKFYIDNKKLASEKFIQGKKVKEFILKEDIMNYALDVDKKGNVHLIYITCDGILNYTVYSYSAKHFNIVTIKDNFFPDTLDIKAIEGNIHIFYKTSNLYKNKSLLCHYYFYNNNCLDEKMIEINCPKYICPYFLDTNENNIYLLYCNDYYRHKYTIKKFNLNSNSWQDFDKNISIENANSLNFFINPHNIGIISYNKSINKNIETLIKYKDFNNSNSTWSKDIVISNNALNSFKPLIFYKENYTYIMWIHGNNIVYKFSDTLTHWSKEYTLNTNENNKGTYAYIYTIPANPNFKINNMYTYCIDHIYSLIQHKLENPHKLNTPYKLNNINSPIYKLPSNNNNLHFNSSSLSKTNYEETIREKNKTIDKINSMNSYLLSQINLLKNDLSDCESTIEKLKSDKLKSEQKLTNDIISYEMEIHNLKSKINDNLMTKNNNIQSLLKIIEEKETTIKNLYNLLKK